MDKNDGSSRRYMGFGLIAAAPFFLFNPDYAVVDFLPDIFGYIFIVLSLRKMRDISSKLSAAYTGFFRLAVVSGFKLLASAMLFALFNEAERPTMRLVMAFCFAVVELILLLPAWKQLYEGLSFLAQTGGGTESVSRRTAGAFRFTYVFFVIKALLSVIPEAAVLSSQKYDDAAYDWSVFTGLFRGIAMFIVLIFGIAWLLVISVRLRGIMKDSTFFDGCRAAYERDVLTKPNLFVRRRIKGILYMFCVSVLLAADFYLDSVNYLPDFLCGAMFLVTFLFAKNYSKKWKYGAAVSAALIPASLAGWIGSNAFHAEYTDIIVQRDPDAWRAFWSFYPLDMLSAALFAAATVFAAMCLKDIIDGHCGYIPETLSEEYRKAKLADIRKELYKSLNLAEAFALASAAASFVYDYAATLYGNLLAESWLTVCFVLSALAFVMYVRTCMAVYDEAESRYMLE